MVTNFDRAFWNPCFSAVPARLRHGGRESLPLRHHKLRDEKPFGISVLRALRISSVEHCGGALPTGVVPRSRAILDSNVRAIEGVSRGSKSLLGQAERARRQSRAPRRPVFSACMILHAFDARDAAGPPKRCCPGSLAWDVRHHRRATGASPPDRDGLRRLGAPQKKGETAQALRSRVAKRSGIGVSPIRLSEGGDARQRGVSPPSHRSGQIEGFLWRRERVADRGTGNRRKAQAVAWVAPL
ncbi:hypothetical protein ACVWWO_005256 [Bradyrhizobium sp. F1.13.1]